MTTLFDCALNNVLLSSLNLRVCVLDIREDAPKMRTTTLPLYPEGQRLLRQQRDSLTIHVDFAIHQEALRRRRLALLKIARWAIQGGVLTTTDRPGQQLPVICTGLPSMSNEDWTEKLTLTFQSHHTSYWEDVAATSVTGSEVLTLNTPGSADFAPLDVVIINDRAEPVTNVTICAGSTQMVFEGLQFQPGSTFRLVQNDGPLAAEIDGESVLSCRTAASADRLLVPCGRSSTVYAAAGEPLQASFTVRGRYV